MYSLSFAGESRLPGHVQIPIAWHKAGWKAPLCSGCLVVSLDLSHAFDTVDRDLLFSRLHSLNLPLDLVHVLREWHRDSRYTLQFADATYEINTSRGVRQGCTIAPLLWLLHLHGIIEELRCLYPAIPWLDLLTAYADDLILCIPIDCEADVAKALDSVVLFFNFLQEKGLTLNLSKTQFLLKLIGKTSSNTFRKYTVRRGGQTCLRLGEEVVPLTSKIDYLGVQLGWGKSADWTLDVRLRKGRWAFASLRTWWKRSSLHPRDQVRLYMTAVLPVLTYGLGAVGLTPKGQSRLEKEVFRHLRRLTRLPSHITHVSNADLIKRYQVMHPTLRVQLAGCRLWKQMMWSTE